MPTTDCTTDAVLPDAQSLDCQIEVSESAPQGTSRPLRGLFFGFAATVTVGLALASWYVGVRLVSADELSAIAPARQGAGTEIAATPQTVPALNEDSIAEAYWYTVPLPQFYLQVAGLGEKQDAAFVRSLEDKGLRARVPSSQGDSARILIGPFSTRSAMGRAQRELESRGVLAIEVEPY
jgi:hypothetical protein